jgi:hypothetical protein
VNVNLGHYLIHIISDAILDPCGLSFRPLNHLIQKLKGLSLLSRNCEVGQSGFALIMRGLEFNKYVRAGLLQLRYYTVPT